MESAKSPLLFVPASIRGQAAQDSLDLKYSMEQQYMSLYGPRQETEMTALLDAILHAEQEVAGARGEAKTDARRVLKTLKAELKDLILRRDRAVQALTAAFDKTESKRFFADPQFHHALFQLCDPRSVATAILAIHQARSGGGDSLFDSAAGLVSEPAAARAGLSTYDFLEQTARTLRSLDLFPFPAAFQNLSRDEINYLNVRNERTVKFICMVLAAPGTHAARRVIEAADSRFLADASFASFSARLVSQLALVAATPDRTRGATVLVGAQSRPAGQLGRRAVEDITCFGCRLPGHYQKHCPTHPPAAVEDASAAVSSGLSAAELVALRRLLVNGRGRAGVSAVAVAGSAAAAPRDPLATHVDFADDDSDDDTA